ncbi:MAG: ankyrin repeat domain-containing protein, partial [Planctomycetota bacterium]
SDHLVFLTPTELTAVIHPAARGVTESGIQCMEGQQTTHVAGNARVNWLVIAKRNHDADDPHFDPTQHVINLARTLPLHFAPTHTAGDWQRQLVTHATQLRSRSPIVLTSAGRHGITQTMASVVPMVWNSQRDGCQPTARNFDPSAGQCSLDCVSIGKPSTQQRRLQYGRFENSVWAQMVHTGDSGADGWWLYASGQVGLDEIGPHGASLLMHALAWRPMIHVAHRYLLAGANVNHRDPKTGITPLHVATAMDNIDGVSMLIDAGADLNPTTVTGTRSVFPSSDFWHTRRQHERPHVGETPLHLAMLHQSYEIAKLLVQRGAAINAEDEHGDRPVDYLPYWSFPDNPIRRRLTCDREPASRQLLLDLLQQLQRASQ